MTLEAPVGDIGRVLRRTPLIPLVSAVVVALAACGGAPEAGADCDKVGYLCGDEDTAFECREVGARGLRNWVELPCRGPEGCRVEGGNVSCDVTHNQVGDACSSSMEGKGICTPDGTAALVCRSGTFTKASDCVSCTVTSDQVVCQP